MRLKAGRVEIIDWNMKEGYSEDDIYRRLLHGMYDNSPIDKVQLRFIAKAFSHEMVLLWNEMNKMKERIFDAPYLVPPSLLAAPVAYKIRCRPLYGADLRELDRDELFVSDNGMSFTLAEQWQGADNTVILENVVCYNTKIYLNTQHPLFSIKVPADKVMMWVKVPGLKVKRVYGGDKSLKVEGIMNELISRLSLLPVIKEGLDNDILSPHCERIVSELAFVRKRMKTDDTYGDNSIFFTVDLKCNDGEDRDCDGSLQSGADDGRRIVAGEYALCSTGRLESGEILKCSSGNNTNGVALEVMDTVCCSYDEADFGAAFRHSVSWRRIWSLNDIRDSSLSLFPNVLKDVKAVKGSFVKHGKGAVSGIIVKLYMKETIGSGEKEFWREKIEEFLTENSPSTYNYMVLVE